MDGDAANEPIEVVIRPEDLVITPPEEGKLQVKVDTSFSAAFQELICDELGNEWDDPFDP